MDRVYDYWLSITPEDEEDTANERQLRNEAAAERRLDAQMFGYDDDHHGRWVRADFEYDPLSKKGFE